MLLSYYCWHTHSLVFLFEEKGHFDLKVKKPRNGQWRLQEGKKNVEPRNLNILVREQMTEILLSVTFTCWWNPSSLSSFIILVLMNLGVRIIIVYIIMLGHSSVSCQHLYLCRKCLLKRLHSQNWNFIDFPLTLTSMEAQVMSLIHISINPILQLWNGKSSNKFETNSCFQVKKKKKILNKKSVVLLYVSKICEQSLHTRNTNLLAESTTVCLESQWQLTCFAQTMCR